MRKRKILIVDENIGFLREFSQVFKDAGYFVRVAYQMQVVFDPSNNSDEGYDLIVIDELSLRDWRDDSCRIDIPLLVIIDNPERDIQEQWMQRITKNFKNKVVFKDRFYLSQNLMESLDGIFER